VTSDAGTGDSGRWSSVRGLDHTRGERGIVDRLYTVGGSRAGLADARGERRAVGRELSREPQRAASHVDADSEPDPLRIVVSRERVAQAGQRSAHRRQRREVDVAAVDSGPARRDPIGASHHPIGALGVVDDEPHLLCARTELARQLRQALLEGIAVAWAQPDDLGAQVGRRTPLGLDGVRARATTQQPRPHAGDLRAGRAAS
jgi:hypothetical protein